MFEVCFPKILGEKIKSETTGERTNINTVRSNQMNSTFQYRQPTPRAVCKSMLKRLTVKFVKRNI